MKILSVIIPCYNEYKTVGKIVDRVLKVPLVGYQKEVIIVDDASRQETIDILKELERLPNVRVFYHTKNRGKGSAIRTALQYVQGDIVIIQDADLEYDPNDYQRILRKFEEPAVQVVYGSRRKEPTNKQYSGLSFYIGGVMLTFLTNLLYGTRISDEPTCYKAFRTSVIRSIPLECKRFEFCPEVTAKVSRKGIRIYEVPIHYYPRTTKQGKQIRWQDGIVSAWILIKYWL